MLTQNSVLMARARASLKDKWGSLAIITLVYGLIMIIAGSPKYFQVISLVISGPMVLGFQKIFLDLIRKREFSLGQLFDGFNNFKTAFVAYLLMLVFVLLWMLLLIVPGIIAAMSYSLVWCIIADNPEIGAMEALRKSKMMMMGNKMKLFYLSCKFLGWILLGCITFGIGFLWIGPYIGASFAHFYQDILDNSTSDRDTVKSLDENVAQII